MLIALRLVNPDKRISPQRHDNEAVDDRQNMAGIQYNRSQPRSQVIFPASITKNISRLLLKC